MQYFISKEMSYTMNLFDLTWLNFLEIEEIKMRIISQQFSSLVA